MSSLNEVIDTEMNLQRQSFAESCHNALIRIIQQQHQKEKMRDIWKDSPFRDLVNLQCNNVGNVGELLMNDICRKSNIDAVCDGSKTKKIGGGNGDGTIMGINVEIKTAHQGSLSPSFQHELGSVPWSCNGYMIFVDIAPMCIYITIFKNLDENGYLNIKRFNCFPTKTVTRRGGKGAFNLDTSIKINESNVDIGNTIRITQYTPNETIGEFIRKRIV